MKVRKREFPTLLRGNISFLLSRFLFCSKVTNSIICYPSSPFNLRPFYYISIFSPSLFSLLLVFSLSFFVFTLSSPHLLPISFSVFYNHCLLPMFSTASSRLLPGLSQSFHPVFSMSSHHCFPFFQGWALRSVAFRTLHSFAF